MNIESPCILLIDDDLLFSSGLVTALKRLGLEPMVVDAPGQVLPRARSLAPRAILINLASRFLNGAERVRELKAESSLFSVPVIGYCGHLEVELIRAGREAGCDRVVANSAITSSLEEILRQAGVVPPPSTDEGIRP